MKSSLTMTLPWRPKKPSTRFPELAQAYRSGEDRDEILRQIIMLRIQTLDNLIDRSIVVQEAKHLIQSQQRQQNARSHVRRRRQGLSRDRKFSPCSRNEHMTEAQLKEQFVKQGRSLEARQQAFRQLFLSESFLHDKLKDRIKVELPDLLNTTMTM